MVTMFSPLVMHLTLVVFLLLFIYGLYLAIRLFMRTEWQWFCLFFITLPTILVYFGMQKIIKLNDSDNFWSSTVIWGFLTLNIVSLLSGFAVYWVMNKYRQQTIFIHFYAFFYFFNAFVITGTLFSVLLSYLTLSPDENSMALDFFLDAMQLSFLYGIVALILGVCIMDYRWRHLKAENKAGKKE